MDGLILFVGGTLIVASGATNGQLKSLYDIVGDSSKQATPDDHKHIVMFFGEWVFVFILAMVAGTSEDAGKMILALLLGLWLVYTMANTQKINSFLSNFTPK